MKKGQKSKSNRTIVAAVADYQCGFCFGLMPPDVILDPYADKEEEWTPRQTEVQRFLWRCIEDDRRKIIKMADADEIVFLHLGDVIHGRKSDHLVTDRISDHLKIAQGCAMRYLELPNVHVARFVKGSKWHSGTGGAAELILARHLRELTGKDVRAWHHMLLTISGVRFDLAHKRVGPGKRVWTEETELRWYVKSVMLDHMKAGQRPPDVILGGHYHDRRIVHQHIHTWKETVDTWGAIVPASSIMLDDYTQAATRARDHMTAGTLAFELVDGRVKDVLDYTHTIDIRKEEILR